MNKETVLRVLGIGALLALDTAISIFCVKEYYREKYERIAQEEIDSMREHYVKATKKAKELTEATEAAAEDLKNYRSQLVKLKYASDPAESEHPSEDVLSEQEEMDATGERITHEDEEDRDKPCEEIHVSEFGENPTYATETLTYYIYDDILVDDQEITIDRPEDLVGGVLLESGFTQNGQDNIYIRNHRLRTDYEIIKVYAGYQELHV